MLNITALDYRTVLGSANGMRLLVTCNEAERNTAELPHGAESSLRSSQMAICRNKTCKC
jgi:hypothetical protein